MTTDHIEKSKVEKVMGLSPAIGIPQQKTDTNPRSTVGTKTGILTILRNMFATLGHQQCPNCKEKVSLPLKNRDKLTIIEKETFFNCPHCNHQLTKLKMDNFSHNSKSGACKECKGVGINVTIDLSTLLDKEKNIFNGGINCWNETLAKHHEKTIQAASKHYNFPFDPSLPLKNYTKEQKEFLLYGISFPSFIQKYKNIKSPKKVSDGNFEGLVTNIVNRYKKNPLNIADDIKKYIKHDACATCQGYCLGEIARTTMINEKNIIDVIKLDLNEFIHWIDNLENILKKEELQIFTAFSTALKERALHLIEVGLDYLTLERTLPSLSGGESQRVKLAHILGTGLTGILYILDEPTTGLHPHDTQKLLITIKKIQEAGNTVLVIEHDMDVIKHADYIIDMGPQGGKKGGHIIAKGTPHDVINTPESCTGKQLKKETAVTIHSFSKTTPKLSIYGASEHNLKNIDVHIPTQQLVVLTGVSGSGKSTFLFDIIHKAAKKYFNNSQESPGKHSSIEGFNLFNKLITVNQKTIGSTKSSRSNVATYTKLFDFIRKLFANIPEAKKRKLGADKFSFNSSTERCQNCDGAGTVEIDMTFMQNIETECPACNGMRFNENIREITFKNLNITDILNLSVNEALSIFKEEKKIYALLHVMKEIGLEYLQLGQSTSTLSGGEAQRIKLASELYKNETGQTLYLLDEPTAGLHPEEVSKLLFVLKKLVSKGNTVIAIEHNTDIICQADTIIDFGPKGGNAGGKVVAIGTPKEVAANKKSLTGNILNN